MFSLTAPSVVHWSLLWEMLVAYATRRRPTAPYFLTTTHLRQSSPSETRYITKRRSARALTHGSACLPLAGASGPYQVLRGGQTHSFQNFVHS